MTLANYYVFIRISGIGERHLFFGEACWVSLWLRRSVTNVSIHSITSIRRRWCRWLINTERISARPVRGRIMLRCDLRHSISCSNSAITLSDPFLKSKHLFSSAADIADRSRWKLWFSWDSLLKVNSCLLLDERSYFGPFCLDLGYSGGVQLFQCVCVLKSFDFRRRERVFETFHGRQHARANSQWRSSFVYIWICNPE